MKKAMACPGMCLLTNNECKKSDFSKQNRKGITETNTQSFMQHPKNGPLFPTLENQSKKN